MKKFTDEENTILEDVGFYGLMRFSFHILPVEQRDRMYKFLLEFKNKILEVFLEKNKQIALSDSWTKHHQRTVEIVMARRRELEEENKKLKEEIEALKLENIKVTVEIE